MQSKKQYLRLLQLKLQYVHGNDSLKYHQIKYMHISILMIELYIDNIPKYIKTPTV